MYSQSGEEAVILANTPATGRCLDLGAWSPLVFSNTRALIERGWDAVLVEPSPGPFQGLMKEYRNNPKVQLINAMVGLEWSLRDFWVTDDALSTTEKASVAKWGGEKNFTAIIVPQVPLSLILAMPFNVINIDTEGTSVDLLCAINLTSLGTHLVCVEFDNQRQRAAEHFTKHGMSIIWENATNLIAKRV